MFWLLECVLIKIHDWSIIYPCIKNRSESLNKEKSVFHFHKDFNPHVDGLVSQIAKKVKLCVGLSVAGSDVLPFNLC